MFFLYLIVCSCWFFFFFFFFFFFLGGGGGGGGGGGNSLCLSKDKVYVDMFFMVFSLESNSCLKTLVEWTKNFMIFLPPSPNIRLGLGLKNCIFFSEVALLGVHKKLFVSRFGFKSIEHWIKLDWTNKVWCTDNLWIVPLSRRLVARHDSFISHSIHLVTNVSFYSCSCAIQIRYVFKVKRYLSTRGFKNKQLDLYYRYGLSMLLYVTW